MKTFNEHAAQRLASLRRQHQQIGDQIRALEIYLNTARPKPPVSKAASNGAKPTKPPAKSKAPR